MFGFRNKATNKNASDPKDVPPPKTPLLNPRIIPNDSLLSAPLIDPSLVEKKDYIPLKYAEEKFQALLDSKLAMKAVFEERELKISQHYDKIIDNMKVHYETFILEVKGKAEKHVEVQRVLRQSVEDQLKAQLKARDATIEELRDTAATNLLNYQDETRKIKLAVKESEGRCIDYSESLNEANRSLAKAECTSVVRDLLFQVEISALTEQVNESKLHTSQRHSAYVERLAKNEQIIQRQSDEIDLLRKHLTNKECESALSNIISIIESNESDRIRLVKENKMNDLLLVSQNKINELVVRSVIESLVANAAASGQSEEINNLRSRICTIENQKKKLEDIKLTLENSIHELNVGNEITETGTDNAVHEIRVDGTITGSGTTLISCPSQCENVYISSLHPSDSAPSTTQDSHYKPEEIESLKMRIEELLMKENIRELKIVEAELAATRLNSLERHLSRSKLSSSKLDTHVENHKKLTKLSTESTFNLTEGSFISQMREEAIPMHNPDDILLIEQLEDKLVEVNLLVANLSQEKLKLADDKAFIQHQLDNMTKEKRTDLVVRLENEITQLKMTSTAQANEITSLKTEKLKASLKNQELADRVALVEKEIKERDAIELAKLSEKEEKSILKTQIGRQRDEIVMKAKAATAGWDAAANADERLEGEVFRAYQRGLAEGKANHKDDMAALNSAVELKEERLTELVVKLNDMEAKVREAATAANQYKIEMEAAKQETIDTIMMFSHMRESQVNKLQDVQADKLDSSDERGLSFGPTSAEYDSLKELLDQSQEEVIELTDKVDTLQEKLNISDQRCNVLDQLLLLERQRSLSTGEPRAQTSKRLHHDVSKITPNDRDVQEVMVAIKSALNRGAVLWKSNKKDECYDLYYQSCDTAIKKLANNNSEAKKILTEAINSSKSMATGKNNQKPKAVSVLKKAFEKFLLISEAKSVDDEVGTAGTAEANENDVTINSEIVDLQMQLDVLNSLNRPSTSLGQEQISSDGGEVIAEEANKSIKNAEPPTSSLLKRAKEAESLVEKLKKQLAFVMTVRQQSIDPAQPAASTNASQPMKRKASDISMEGAEIRRLNRRVKELESQLQLSKSGEDAVDKKALANLEKQLQKKAKDSEAAMKKERAALESRALKAEKALESTTAMLDPITKERDMLRIKTRDMITMNEELTNLRKISELFAETNSQLEQRNNELALLTEQFKKEAALRKKYKNELEDLKGAIRVFARCRPMAKYELETGCKQVVHFKDDMAMKLFTSRGERDFDFDSVFNHTSTQEQVFEDAKRLVESCIDGFNVCIFAYGQTGSGKTFTMTGSPEQPGLTPRSVQEIFTLIKQKSNFSFKVSTYFVELYNDNLVDLYWIIENRGQIRNVDGSMIEPPRLDIKLDARKMVTITNVVVKQANTYEELMALYETGNAERHVGSTKMNAASSRSHSIFAVIVESFDPTTKRTTFGKLSLVDLAGSERNDKTGATGNTLKEAQSINKSLSALGNVIAALSEGEKHIPYRSNKLTQLMQDSLGGNAKTLMFVNFSPADYNVDETYSSLNYAARVKKIVNSATKQAETEEISRLKQIIKKLQSGQAVAAEDIAGVQLVADKNGEQDDELNGNDPGPDRNVDIEPVTNE